MLLGKPGDTYLLGVQGTLSLPLPRLDDAAAYRGGQGVTFLPPLIGEFRLPKARIALNIGSLIRGKTEFPTFDAGSELRYAVSFGVPFAGHFEARPAGTKL